MLVLLLPPIGDGLPEWSNNCPAVVANCFGLGSESYWSVQLDSLRDEYVEPEEQTLCFQNVQWEYTKSVSPRLTLITYPLDAPLVNIWVGGREPIPEGAPLAQALAKCIGSTKTKIDVRSLSEDHRYFLRRRCHEELAELACYLNEATPQEVTTLLMSPGVAPVHMLRSTLSTDQLTSVEEALLTYKKGQSTTLLSDNPIDRLVQEIDLCRRGWLKPKLTRRPKKLLSDKRDEELKKLLFAGTFASRLKAQKITFRNCSPLPPLLQYTCLPDEVASVDYSALPRPLPLGIKFENIYDSTPVEPQVVPTIALGTKTT